MVTNRLLKEHRPLSLLLLALLMLVVSATIASAASGPSSSASDLTVQSPRASAATVKFAAPGFAVQRVQVRCGAGARERCQRVAGLIRPRRRERCLQIWGGPARAEVAVNGKRGVISRANSCEIARFERLRALIR